MCGLTAGVALGDGAKHDVENVVRQYARAADARDAETMDKVLHDKFRVVASMGGKLVALEKTDYVGSLKAGKIGGEPREVRIDTVALSGDYAFADVTLTGKERTFRDHLVLYREASGWRILQNAAQVGGK
jgi:hypothetical protein